MTFRNKCNEGKKLTLLADPPDDSGNYSVSVTLTTAASNQQTTRKIVERESRLSSSDAAYKCLMSEELKFEAEQYSPRLQTFLQAPARYVFCFIAI